MTTTATTGDGFPTPAYFLAADDTLDLARERAHGELERLRGMMVQALLFESQLLFPDSYAINNANLRRLLRADPLVRDLTIQGLLSVAVRTESGQMRSLRQLRDEYFAQGRHPTDGFEGDEYHRESAELDFLEARCQLRPYRLDDLAAHYSVGIVEALADPENRATLGEQAHAAICALVRDELAKPATTRLNYSWFFYLDRENSIGPLLEARCGPGTLERVGPALKEIANAPYLSALPTAIRANPVYTQAHSRAVDIWRRRHRSSWEKTGDPFVFEGKADLATYSHGLAQLGFQDIAFLRQSDECRALQAALRAVSTGKVDVKELNQAYRDYRYRIDDTILQRMGLVPAGPLPPIKLDHSTGGFAGEVLKTSVLAGVDVATGGLAGTALGLVASAFQYMTGHDAESEARRKALAEAMKQRLEAVAVHNDALSTAHEIMEEKMAQAQNYRLRWLSSIFGSDVHDTLSK
jgi:hypothetical protein